MNNIDYELLSLTKHVDSYGNISYKNERGDFHRLNGPALEHIDVTIWMVNGGIHRDDGPAVIFKDGREIWYRRGAPYQPDSSAMSNWQASKWDT